MIIIDDINQRDPEWYQIRAGIPTASEFSKIVHKDGKPSKSQTKYMYKLAGERLLGYSENGYQSYDMKKGTEREGEARAYYEFMTGDRVVQVGFVFKDEKKNVGCSPDGFVPSHYRKFYHPHSPDPDAGKHPAIGLEIKCPNLENHVAQLLTKELPPDKYHQIQGCMLICGLHTWQFISYYPNMPLFVLEVQRDIKFCSDLEYELGIFLQELEIVYNKLKGDHGG